jgi:glycogen operon protein
MPGWTSTEGAPAPLGASWVEGGQACNFALYSKHADAVVLLLYADGDAATPVHVERLSYLTNKSGRVWHCRLPASVVSRARYYAYRVEGPFDLVAGHRFDAAKVLLDPHATAVHFPARFAREAAMRPGPNDGSAPLARIPDAADGWDWSGDRRVSHEADTIIYEMHVKGYTKSDTSGVAPDRRGTYLGIIDKIPYLTELGVTAVELLPVHQRDPQEGNYWGYMTLTFFSPEQSYASAPERAADEFRAMVKALHAADIEVILDVAYSHTCEGNENGPTYSFRGIDNTTYYLLEKERRWYRDDSGCGNVVHTANRYVRGMIIDSLLYWVRDMHVDGFRFDMASLFSRAEDGSIGLEDPPIVGEISSLSELAGIRVIAEPWDMATYQLGRSFPGARWAQWNARFRDEVRAFVRGDEGRIDGLIRRLYGSDDLFPDTLIDAYHPFQSVNFVTSHDGFCLYDLVAYDGKHNLANGHGNTDGVKENWSWNCGWEGDAGAPGEVIALRRRQVKNFCCLLMLANGTPMLVAGDEFMQTQSGNNNPYNQDNATTWLDWSRLDANRDVFRFFRKMIAFRKRHPSIARSRYWRGDVRWYGTRGDVDRSAGCHTLAYCLHGASQGDRDLYVMANAGVDEAAFDVQEGRSDTWLRAIDTGLDSPDDICGAGREVPVGALRCVLRPRSVTVLISRT